MRPRARRHRRRARGPCRRRGDAASTAGLGTGALAGRRATYATDPAEAVGPEVRLVDQQPVEVVLRVDGDTWSGTTGGGTATDEVLEGTGLDLADVRLRRAGTGGGADRPARLSASFVCG